MSKNRRGFCVGTGLVELAKSRLGGVPVRASDRTATLVRQAHRPVFDPEAQTRRERSRRKGCPYGWKDADPGIPEVEDAKVRLAELKAGI